MTNLAIADLKKQLNKVYSSSRRGLITSLEAMAYVQGMKKMLDLLGLLDQEAMEVFYDYDMLELGLREEEL